VARRLAVDHAQPVQLPDVAGGRHGVRAVPSRGLHLQAGVHDQDLQNQRQSEKDTKLAQKLGPIQPFIAVLYPRRNALGQLALFGST
jgi:hypothetical protein